MSGHGPPVQTKSRCDNVGGLDEHATCLFFTGILYSLDRAQPAPIDKILMIRHMTCPRKFSSMIGPIKDLCPHPKLRCKNPPEDTQSQGRRSLRIIGGHKRRLGGLGNGSPPAAEPR